jgi:peptidoglycan/xylan/chitin deacetylase (PgdA/CDA1 family)
VRPHIDKESKAQDLYDITPELFEQQLKYLQDNGYHIIVPKDLFVDDKTGKIVTNVEKPVMLTFDDGWKNQYEYAYPLLKKYNDKAVFYVYIQTIGAPSFLTWDYIKEMNDNGMVIGSHTLSHPHLKRLSDEILHHEIFDSKKILEKKLGITIDDFATPYGYSDDRISTMVKDAGYKTSRTLFRGSYHKDMFNLKGYLTHDAFKDFVAVLESKE